MNIISIDPSLISTAVAIGNKKNGLKLINYCREEDATLSKGGLSKWFKLCEQHLELKYIKYRKFNTYSEGEIIKLKDYDLITTQIINDIEKYIDRSEPIRIGIEGYSFSSAAGDIVDLVTFSTLLRKKLFDQISQDITVVSPSTLKQESCKLTYKPIDIGKKKPKLEYRNNAGIAGGKFTKTEIYLSIIENTDLNDYWSILCTSLRDDILAGKTIKKPFEDVNDSYVLYHILKNNSI